MARGDNPGIVVDGRRRIRKDDLERVRKEVAAKYAARLATAGPVGRFLLRWRLHRDVERELAKLAPPGALYFGE